MLGKALRIFSVGVGPKLSNAFEDDAQNSVSSCYCRSYVATGEHVYVPVQHEDRTCFIDKVNVKTGTKAERVVQVVKMSDGEKKISPFGSEVSRDGILWLCCFSESMLLAIDLKSAPALTVLAEVKVPGSRPERERHRQFFANCDLGYASFI